VVVPLQARPPPTLHARAVRGYDYRMRSNMWLWNGDELASIDWDAQVQAMSAVSDYGRTHKSPVTQDMSDMNERLWLHSVQCPQECKCDKRAESAAPIVAT
jgi:hypothetical protein